MARGNASTGKTKGTQRDKQLAEELRFVQRAHDQLLEEQEGKPFLARVVKLRELAVGLRKEYKRADERKLRRVLASQGAGQLCGIARSFTVYFWLANVCERRHEMRLRKPGEAGTLDDLFKRLKRSRVPQTEIERAVRELRTKIVLTAHPTDAIRRSVTEALDRIEEGLDHRAALRVADIPAATRRREVEAVEEAILEELTALWQTTAARHKKPDPVDEVRHAIRTIESVLVPALPLVTARLAAALSPGAPSQETGAHQTLAIGSWIGGDRDGNPFVTAETTQTALQLYRSSILRQYLLALDPLIAQLSISTRRATASDALRASLERDLERLPELQRRVAEFSPIELYRQKLNGIAVRLEANLAENEAKEAFGSRGGYREATELVDELMLVRDSLRANRGERLADSGLRRLVHQVEVCGFHMVELDVRQHEGRHAQARRELICPATGPFESLSLEEQRRFLEERVLADDLPQVEAIRPGLSPEAAEVLDTLVAARKALESGDPRSLRDLVISNTESETAIMELLVLARQAGLVERSGDGSLQSQVDIVPLFESIGSLRSGVRVMEGLYASPAYRAQLAARGNRQQIMLGYSDSVKDGGYLAAHVGLYRVQRELAAQADSQGIEIEFFHGRGGTIARGGGPSHRAILAQPPGTVRGRIKLTEQGEVIASKYGSVESATYHLELMLAATLEATLLGRGKAGKPSVPKVPKSWDATLDVLADASRAAFRSLVYETEGFVDVFYEMTPIEEISKLKIGSRPAKRTSTRRIEDLRAIPWIFSWNQNRVLLPSWYGAGSGFEAALAAGPSRKKALEQMQAMYRRWPFFRVVIDNLRQVLAKVALHIASSYAELAERDAAAAGIVFAAIEREYELTSRAVRKIAGERKLLGNDAELSQMLELRAPYLDALSYLQVELLERKRGGEVPKEERGPLGAALHLTINGIAAGLRNTG